jgi:hypothetical protein
MTTRAALYDAIHADQGRLPDARDLWGYAPRRRVYCLGCGKKSEPWHAGKCWCCIHAAEALAAVKSQQPGG